VRRILFRRRVVAVVRAVLLDRDPGQSARGVGSTLAVRPSRVYRNLSLVIMPSDIRLVVGTLLMKILSDLLVEVPGLTAPTSKSA